MDSDIATAEMNKVSPLEIFVKLEPEDPDINHQDAQNGVANTSDQPEVWVKTEPAEAITQLAVKSEHNALVANGTENVDKKKDLKLPLKKRFEVQLKNATAEVSQNKTSEGDAKQPPSKPKPEIPPMYSYDITKHIEIFTIDENQRQIEHREILSTKQHMRLVCEHCAVGFVLDEAFAAHMKAHSPESGAHECDICHSYVKSADILYRHRLRHFRRYRCLLCAKEFKDKDKANSHVMADHAGQAFQCKNCHRTFKRPQYLKRHEEQYHKRTLQLQCNVCSKVFYERGWYRAHVRTHNRDVKTKTVRVVMICDFCSRKFHTKASLIRHLETHDTESMVCTICRQQYTNRNDLGQHYLNVHNEIYKGAPDSTCPVCLRVCLTRALLRHHMRRMHTDRTKKYQCDYCQRLYLTKGEVRSHIMWSHLHARGHECPCGRVFRSPSLLKSHRARLHSQYPMPRNHSCDDCGKAFHNKQILNRHKKSHSNELYPCNECGLLFKSQPYVKIHYQTKHMNMTRAQIKANAQLKRAQGPGKDGQPAQESYPNGENVPDPLELDGGESHTKIDIELPISVPLFQTFANVNEQ